MRISVSINRNIVECKETYHVVGIPDHFRINRNIVECKDKCRHCVSAVCDVLIET